MAKDRDFRFEMPELGWVVKVKGPGPLMTVEGRSGHSTVSCVWFGYDPDSQD